MSVHTVMTVSRCAEENKFFGCKTEAHVENLDVFVSGNKKTD
ncbi:MULTISPECIES: hypothetical protein [Paenibacillus]|nr:MULTISPECIES: hypothetical protein [unclassified Paenibacillus]